MKKILFSIILVVIFTTTGCTKIANTPTKQVEALMGKYQTLDSAVLDDLNNVLNNEESLTNEQQDRYKELLKKQYRNLTYTIKEEEVDGDNAIVTTEIEVIDLTGAMKEAENDLDTNSELFYDEEGTFSQNKYVDYKLDKMENAKNKVTYTLDLTLTKIDEEWQLDNLTETERQKIHGIYNY